MLCQHENCSFALVIGTAVTETANELLGKRRPVKKPWVTPNILQLCDKRRELKKKKNETKERAEQ